MPGALAIELMKYERAKPALLARRGDYVLIKGVFMRGIWREREDALNWGYRLFRDEDFLVRQILEEQPVRHLPTMWRV